MSLDFQPPFYTPNAPRAKRAQVLEEAPLICKATGGVVVDPDRDRVAVKADLMGAASPIGLQGQAYLPCLTPGEAWRDRGAPSLKEETELSLHATTNPEGGPRKREKVSPGLREVCIVSRLL